MVYLKDGRGRWLMANPATALAVMGLSEQAIGRSDLELAELGSRMASFLRLSALNEEASWQAARPTHLQEVAEDGGACRVPSMWCGCPASGAMATACTSW
jgi:hypothetical protein